MGEKSELNLTVLVVHCKNCKYALFCKMNQMWKGMMVSHSIIVQYFKSCFSNHALLRSPLGHYLCGFSFLWLLTTLILPHPHLWMALLWFSQFSTLSTLLTNKYPAVLVYCWLAFYLNWTAKCWHLEGPLPCWSFSAFQTLRCMGIT